MLLSELSEKKGIQVEDGSAMVFWRDTDVIFNGEQGD